jgi:hypothetical protein
MKPTAERLMGLAALLVSATAGADALEPVLTRTKPIVDARMRYEDVEQTPLTETAQANTVRLRAGFETGKVRSTTLLAEGEAITPLHDEYRADNSRPLNLTHPVVADPESYEVNRLQLTNTSLPGTTLTLGRQRIVLDDHRFVGNVGWRQNEQTFDAVRIVNKSVAKLTIDSAYLNQVNRIYGPESPQGRYHGDAFLGNVAYQLPIGKLTTFGYLLDFDPLTDFPGLTAAQAAALNPTRVSTRTLGMRFSGERPVGVLKVGYVGSYAQQSDYGGNPLSFDLDYYIVEIAATFRQFSVALGQEVLEGNGTTGFSTPLATLHRFNGWADKFLTTPADGIDDRSVSAGYALQRIAMLDALTAAVAYRDYRTERGAVDLGAELDLQLQAKYGRFVALFKYADYDAHEGVTPPAYQDTRKFWVQIEYVW